MLNSLRELVTLCDSVGGRSKRARFRSERHPRPGFASRLRGQGGRAPELPLAIGMLSVLLAACGSGAGIPLFGGVAANSPSLTAYVCNFAYQSQPGTTVARVSTANQSAEPSLDVGQLPSAEAATPDGRYLLVADEGYDQLAVVDLATGRVIHRVVTGLEPDAVAVTPDGKLAVVANMGDNTVTPVNLSDWHAMNPIPVGSRPDAIGIGGTSGRIAVVANYESSNATEVNLATLSEGASVPVGSEPDAVAIGPGGSTAMVAAFGDGRLTSINLAGFSVTSEAAVSGGATGIAGVGTSTGGPSTSDTAWVTSGSNVTPVLFGSLSMGPPVLLGDIAEGASFSNGGTTLWVAEINSQIAPVNPATSQVGKPVFVGGRPSAIVIPPSAK